MLKILILFNLKHVLMCKSEISDFGRVFSQKNTYIYVLKKHSLPYMLIILLHQKIYVQLIILFYRIIYIVQKIYLIYMHIFTFVCIFDFKKSIYFNLNIWCQCIYSFKFKLIQLPYLCKIYTKDVENLNCAISCYR